MSAKPNKNLIYAAVFIVLIIFGYFVYGYFGGSSETTAGNDGIYAKNSDSAGAETGMPANDGAATGGVKTQSVGDSLARFQKISQSSNLSDFNGQDIYDLILTLEQVKLDINFFNDDKFRSFVDFTKEIKVSDEEKGNINPFRPSASISYISSGATSSDKKK